MDFEQFQRRVETDERLADYLDDLTQSVGEVHRSVGLDLLFGVAAYALCRVVRRYFDHQQGLQEAEFRRLMEAEVESLVQKGWSRDKALSAVLQVSKAIGRLPMDGPIIQAALGLLKGGNNSVVSE